MSMPTCPSCIYAQGICEKTGVKIRYSTGCTYHKPKRITNADHIRAMTNEELAEALCLIVGGLGPVSSADGWDWLEWLKEKRDY